MRHLPPLLIVLVGLWLILPTTIAGAQEARLIENVQVEGNDYIPREGILDEVKDILVVGQPFTTERQNAARQTVMRMGYFDDVQVTAEDTEKGVSVVITVVEKERVQTILFVGNTVVDDSRLADIIFTKIGHVYDANAVRRDVRRIEDFYAEQGYIAHVSRATWGEYGVLTIVIEEARVEDITIEGLKRTKPLVVQRELTIEAGELFHDRRLLRDIQKINNLGIFEKVSFDIKPGVRDPQRGVIVVITVEEKRTGQASVAAGYSSLDKFVLVLSLAENNFRGRSERVSLSLELFGRTSYEASYFQPYLDSKGTSLSARVYDTERKRRFVGGTAISTSEDSFDERRSGGTLALTTPLAETTKATLRFRSEKVSSSFFQGTRILPPGMQTASGGVGTSQWSPIDTPGSERPGERPPDNPSLDPDIPEPGDTLGPIVVAAPLHPGGRLNSVTFGWTQDTRDIIANPTRGHFTSFNYEEAGSFLGGDTDFRKIMAERRYFRQISDKRDVIAARLMAGTSFGALPLFESYSVGGGSSLRGYQEDRFRGEKMLLLNVEYRRPITDNLTAVAFVDVGDAFGGEFPTIVPGFRVPAEDQRFKAHVGAGIGLRVVTPIGPIRLDFGWGDDGSETHFSFGHTF